LRSDLIISAQDKTGGVIERIAGKFAGLVGSMSKMDATMARFGRTMRWGGDFQKELDKLKLGGAELDRLAASWDRLQAKFRATPTSMNEMTAATERWKNSTLSGLRAVTSQTERLERIQRGMGRLVGGLGGAYVGQRIARTGLEKIAEGQREGARQYAAGFKPEEIPLVAAKAREISAKYPSVGQVGVAEHIRLLVGRFGSLPHALDTVEDLVKAQVVLKTVTGGQESAHDLERLVLGEESLGLGADPAKFRRMLSAFVKAKSLFPDIKGEDFRVFMARANASKYALSEDFLANVAPTLIQHEGAAQFGTSMSSAFSALIGERQTKEAKATMRKYGLLDKSGHLAKARLFEEHPEQWAKDFLLPHLEKKGIKLDDEHRPELVEAVTRMFSNRKVGDLFASLLINKDLIAKDRERLSAAKGLEAADEVRQRDPFVAAQGVSEQIWNFLQNVGGPYGERAAAVLNSIADSIGRMAKSMGEDPKTAAYVGAGVAAGGAAAVYGSAKAFGWGARKFLRSVLGPGGEERPIISTDAPPDVTISGGKTTYAKPLEWWEKLPGRVPEWVKNAGGAGIGSFLMPIIGIASQPDIKTKTRGGESMAKALKRFRDGASPWWPSLMPSGLPTDAVPDASWHRQPWLDVSPWGPGASSYSLGKGAAEPVKAEIEGNATLKVDVDVKPSPSFLTEIRTTMDNKINAFRQSGAPATGTSGAVGVSMPEASSAHQ